MWGISALLYALTFLLYAGGENHDIQLMAAGIFACNTVWTFLVWVLDL